MHYQRTLKYRFNVVFLREHPQEGKYIISTNFRVAMMSSLEESRT
jgi:hypothetical protein